MKSLSKIFLAGFFFSFFCLKAFSQQESGYLFRCYVSNKLEWKTLTSYDLLNCFLNISDLRDEIIDSAYYTPSREGLIFPKLFLKLFQNNLQLIDEIPRKKETLDSNCKFERIISLKDAPLYDFVYTYKLTTEDFFYIVMVNKVSIEYCSLNQYSDYELMFKQRVALKSFPCFSKLNTHEIDFFGKAFRKFLNLKGEIFYRSSL